VYCSQFVVVVVVVVVLESEWESEVDAVRVRVVRVIMGRSLFEVRRVETVWRLIAAVDMSITFEKSLDDGVDVDFAQFSHGRVVPREGKEEER
jgi:hypothetical protein